MAFYDNYTALCEKAGRSPSFVAEAVGLTKSSVTGWKRGTIPSGENLQKIADYFGVTTDYLLTGNEYDAVVTYDPDTEIFLCLDLIKDPSIRQVLLRLKDASPGDLKKVNDMLDILLGGNIKNA